MKPVSLLRTPPLSLYIHIPWCVRKCPYCDFNSHEAKVAVDKREYVAALMADLDQEAGMTGQREIESIFFGGGTPSLFSGDAIHNILEGVRQRLPVAADAEITLEANPGTFEQQNFADYRACGVNRLSIGIQSFEDEKLAALGRIHDHREAVRAVETARSAGFENINLDLMFGLPGQSLQQAVSDIEQACAFEPSHISHYQLTIEANTWFHKHTPVLPETDAIWEMQQACHEHLDRHGYQQYEVSAFAHDRVQCLHNINYWGFGDYIGIGAGAHGKISDAANGTIIRRWKQRQPAAYIRLAREGEACSGSNRLTQPDILFEFLMNALRLRRGFSYELFEQRTGIDRQQLVEACSSVDADLLLVSEQGITTTDRGFDFLNHVLERFLVSEQ